MIQDQVKKAVISAGSDEVRSSPNLKQSSTA
ncbi:UNVERIFIED_CONTAM: hypothetical protein GTU68_038724 [Idotea baltica]|nr:hypothetical protein [Idotea baltica]